MASPYERPLSSIKTDPVRNFKFLVNFYPHTSSGSLTTDKFAQFGFVSVSGLNVTTEPIAYREGGYNTNVHQIPGQSSFTPISLSRGVLLGADASALWMKRLFSVIASDANSPSGKAGGVGSDFRCDLDIQVLSHPNPAAYNNSGGTTATVGTDMHTSMRFRVYNAWITSLAYSNLDAGSNAVMVEEMVLVHEGFDVSYGTAYDAAGSAPKFTF